MKVLIATGLYPPDVGGPATYSKLLAEQLPHHGIEVVVLTFGTVRHLLPGIRHVMFLVSVLKAARTVDIVFALDPWSVGVPAYLGALFLRKPFIVRIAGDYAWEQGVQRFGVTEDLNRFSKKTKPYPLMVRLMKWMQCVIAVQASAVVVPSNYLKKIVSNWGVSKRQITVIYNAVPNIAVRGRKSVLRSMVKARGPVIMTAGRLTPWKGVDGLIRLMPQLSKKFPDLKLVIAGSGPEQDALERCAEECGVAEQVVFLGSLEQDVLFSYIKIADVFVLNTSYEGFSHQLLEAMSIGTPVVTTNIGGNPELVVHEKSGLLVSPGDQKALMKAISHVLNSKAMRDQLVRGGKKQVQQFTEERLVGETKIFLQRFI
jgi:glycosyltransferase involved in cell wall biosynthesis